MPKKQRTAGRKRAPGVQRTMVIKALSIAACVMLLVVVIYMINQRQRQIENVTLADEETNVITVTMEDGEVSEIAALIDTEMEADETYVDEAEGAVYLSIDALNTVYASDLYFFDWNEYKAYVTTLADGTTTTSMADWPVVWYEDEPYVELAWAADFFDFTYEITGRRAVTLSETSETEAETVTLSTDYPDTPIVLLWYQDTTGTYSETQTEKLAASAGTANVFSPTWFTLTEDGSISSLLNEDWISWAHGNGMQVWALFSNGFDDEMTLQVLSDASLRKSLVKSLLSYCKKYGLDGINMDFESMSAETCGYYVQFMRELGYALRNEGYILSVDVSVPANWSSYYRRDLLAEASDYIIVMGYDEHYAGSAAGSTASLSWTSEAVEAMLALVPAEKLILGVPFYTRLWTTTEDGVSCEALSMDEVAAWIEENGLSTVYDEDTGQNYVSMTSDPEADEDEEDADTEDADAEASDEEDADTKDADAETSDTSEEGTSETILYQIWIEDETSMSERLEIATSSELAGIACWKAGMEAEEIWELIAAYRTGDS